MIKRHIFSRRRVPSFVVLALSISIWEFCHVNSFTTSVLFCYTSQFSLQYSFGCRSSINQCSTSSFFLRLHMPGFSLKISLERGRWQRPVQEYKMCPNFFEELVSKLRRSTSKFVVKSKTSCLKFGFVPMLDNLAFLKLFMRQLPM